MPARPAATQDIRAATAAYERWLGTRIRLIPADLARKHAAMRADVFRFFRGTYYRWAQRWATVCPAEAHAPRLLGVGDLHVENFGTWRDAEGRLAWGVNDLDEAWPLPYTNDLVRLATSALIAIDTHGLDISANEAVDVILDGYRDGLAEPAQPYVLAEGHPALHRIATARLRNPQAYWEQLNGFRKPATPPPPAVRMALERSLPARKLPMRILHRIAGMGSLGRPRYMIVADWRGGFVAREAKPLAASGAAWAAGKPASTRALVADLFARAVRCPDPFVRIRSGWLVRRLAPDCSRIDLTSLPDERDETHLMHAMGRETANVHVGSVAANVLAADLRRRPKHWLRDAAERMAEDVARDWKRYRKPG